MRWNSAHKNSQLVLEIVPMCCFYRIQVLLQPPPADDIFRIGSARGKQNRVLVNYQGRGLLPVRFAF